MRAGRTRPRPSSRARVAACAAQTLASPPFRFPEPRSPAAPWRGSSIPRPGGPGRPRLPNHEPQPPCGLDPQRRVEEPRRQMPRLGLLSAGPWTKSASNRAAAKRSSAVPRQGSPVPPRPSGDPRTRLAEQIGGGLSPAPALRTFPVAGAPGDSRGREKRRRRAGRSPPPEASALSQRAGVAQRPGRKDVPSLSPEPSAAPAASLARPSGSVSRHNPAPFLPPGPAISRILGGKKKCTSELGAGAARETREAGRQARPGCSDLCLLRVSPALLIAGVGWGAFSVSQIYSEIESLGTEGPYNCITSIAVALCPKWARALAAQTLRSPETPSLLAPGLMLVFSMERASEFPQERLSK